MRPCELDFLSKDAHQQGKCTDKSRPSQGIGNNADRLYEFASPGETPVRAIIENSPLLPSLDLDVNVCDTEYSSRNKGFPAFRDAISSAFMPWLLEYKSDIEFDGRMTWMASDSGTIARVKMSPVIAVRKNAEKLPNHPFDCFYANYILAGNLTVEQSGRTTIAKRGDIVVYDSNLPVKITERSAWIL